MRLIYIFFFLRMRKSFGIVNSDYTNINTNYIPKSNDAVFISYTNGVRTDIKVKDIVKKYLK